MKHISPLLITLFALCIGVVNVWAAETLTINGNASGNNAPWGTSYGDGSGTSVTSGGTSVGMTYTQTASMSSTIQIKKGTSNGFYSTSVPANSVITSIAIISKTNSVSLYVSKDGSNWGTATSISSTTTKTYTTAEGYLYFKINATSKYAQITSIVVTYESTGSSCTKPTFTIEDKTISLEEAKVFDLSALATNIGGSTGNITYTCNDAKVEIADELCTITTPGTYTITATMAADDTYCEATTTFTITVQSPPCTQLTAPTGLNASALTYSSATLKWDAVENATKYEITTTPPIFGSSTIRETSETTYAATGLSPATEYKWTVKAIGDGSAYCDSEESTSGTFTTPAKPKYTITWSTPTGASTTQVTQGDKIGTLLAEPTAPIGCSDKVFMGWSATNIGTTGIDKAPDFITAETVPSDNVTYYAVFATASESSTGASGSLEITISNFTEITTSYTTVFTHTYTDATVVAKGVYKNSKGIQMNSGKGTYIKNTTALPGPITNITCTWSETGKNSPTLYVAKGGVASTSSTNLGKQSNTSTTQSVDVSASEGYDYFYFDGTTVTGACYLTSLKITYGAASTTYTDYVTNCVECTAPATPLALSVAETTLNLGEDGTVMTTFSTTSGNGGTIDYAVNPTAGATLDKDNKTITFNAAGTYTLTASQNLNTTDGTTYCGSRDSKTVTVTSTPVLYFITTPADPIEFPEVECGGNTPLGQKKQISLQGYNLTGDVSVTVTGDYKIARTASSALGDYTTELTLPKTTAGKINATYSSVYVISCPPAQSSSATNGTLTFTTDDGNTLTVNLSTSTVICKEYTLTLYDRGSKSDDGTYYAGASVPQPADPTGVCTEPINYVFDGWATAEVANGSTTYTPISFPYTMPKGNTTLYAVYKYAEGEGVSKVSAADVVDGGKYYITATYDDTEYILKAGKFSAKGSDKYTTVFDIEMATEDMAWTFVKSNSGWSIQNGDNKLGTTDNNNGLSSSTSNVGTWTCAATIAGSTTVKLTYSSSYSRILSLYDGQDWRTYTGSNGIQTIQLYSATAYYYTTSPVCGPYIKAIGDIAITSGKGIWVESVTPLTISAKNLDKNEDGAAVTITVTSQNAAFTIKGKDVSGSGAQSLTITNYTKATLDTTLTVVYTPTRDNVIEDGEIGLCVTRYNGQKEYATASIKVRGRSLPAEFVIAAKTADGWVALPNDLGATYNETLKAPYKIEVNDNTNPTIATEAPTTAVYHTAMRSTANTCANGIRFEANGTYLEGGTAAENNNVWLSATDSKEYQSWVLTGTDFTDYSVRMEASAEGQCLHYNTNQNTNKIGNYAGKGTLRFLPIENKCTRFDAPVLDRKKLTSTSITLRWLAIENATGYEYSTDESDWETIENATMEDNYVVATIGDLVAATKHTLYVRVETDGENCSDVASISFQTPLCDDVPTDIHYLSTINSITLMWNSEAKTSTVVLYSDKEGTTEQKRITNASSPATIDGLERATTYYAQVLAGGTCGADLVEVSTERPQMDVVEWAPDAIDVSINTNEKVSVVLENEITKGTGHAATDLFFSKYFEASGSVKLLAIYNGTGKTISLENVRIEGMAVTSATATDWDADEYDIIELSPLKEIKSDEEIVLYSLLTHHTVDYENAVDADGASTAKDKNRSISIAKCINSSIGWNQNGWYPVGDNTINVLEDAGVVGMTNLFGDAEIATGGNKTYRLIRQDAEGNDMDIDVLGVLTEDKQVIKTSDMKQPTDGDATGWICANGREYDSDSDKDYELSTNRHLLIRKNTVTSGLHAVESNTDGFSTLCEEWEGRTVKKGSDENATTCEEFSNVSGFQYNEYYTTYETLVDNTEFDESKRNPDGTYTISVPGLNKLACCKLKIIAKDKDGIELLTKEYRVPIMVTSDADTKNALFRFEGDTCKNCDVVVRDKAKLTHTKDGVNEFRNMYVYAGSQLEIPTAETFTLNAVQMFARNDSVSYAIINNAEGTAISIQELSHIKRIDGKYWYPFSLPYDCEIADIRDLSGESLGVYGTDWGIKFYNGKRRQSDGNSTTHYGEVSKYWEMMEEEETLKAYTGYIIGLFYPDENLMKSVYFVPDGENAYTESADAKTTPITNWPDNLSAQPRHHGWNFVGSPYISLFGVAKDEGLYNDQLTMGWTDERGEQQDKEHIYVSIPNGGNSNTYTQAQASGVTIKPFTAYFVQAIDPTNGQSNTLDLTYSKGNRRLLAPARAQEVTPLILAELDIRCGALHDNAGVLVSDTYSADYEIGDDLYKMYAAEGKPQLYTTDARNDRMAYQALPDLLAHAVPLGIYVPSAGDYTLSLNRSLSRLTMADAVYLLYNGSVVADLLRADYTLSTTARGTLGGYTLDIRRAPKMPTNLDPTDGDTPYLILRDGMLAIANLPAEATIQVYDVLGRLLLRTTATEPSLSIQAVQTGVYTVLITTDQQQTVLKTLLR